MRKSAACIFAFVVSLAFARKSDIPQPSQFVIARHTFVDFGPPLDFYELYLVRPITGGSSIERITLTPPGGSCMQPAKVETAAATLNESPQALLGQSNPCAIPDKELAREVKRCKNCLVFSGANVAVQVQCETRSRIIRANVLDRDMFDPAPNTPRHTSWTMQLLSRLDEAVGPDVMDKPIFPVTEPPSAPPQSISTLMDIGAGTYDALFQGAPDKPSVLYRMAQTPIPKPDVRIVISPPFGTEKVAVPIYPPLARLANIEGVVSIEFVIDKDGGTTGLEFKDGHPMFRPAVTEAAESWKFPKDAAGRQVEATIYFKANCPRPQ
jgi:TonB family protein